MGTTRYGSKGTRFEREEQRQARRGAKDPHAAAARSLSRKAARQHSDREAARDSTH